MIKKIFANKESFKTVEFLPGFNLILAERTKNSTKTDSRNGLGKSTLIEILHFCLGSQAKKNQGLLVEPLKDWEFGLIMSIDDEEITVTREINNPKYVQIEGDLPHIRKIGKKTLFGTSLDVKEWTSMLGESLLGLSPANRNYKTQPSFRSVISYFIRKGKDAYSKPFEYFRKQNTWEIQVNNAFLLGLSWENAAQLQILKDEQEQIKNTKKLLNAGLILKNEGSIGDLEAQQVQLHGKLKKEEEDLKSFKVHSQYHQIHQDANLLSEKLHSYTNDLIMNDQLLKLYQDNLVDEEPASINNLKEIYSECNVVFPEITLRLLDEVEQFHHTIIKNRKSFLETEIIRLKQKNSKLNEHIEKITNDRATLLEILESQGALEELNLLQKKHWDTVNEYDTISQVLENLKNFETRLSELKIALEIQQQKASREYDERRNIREKVISYFNEYSEYLYHSPGKLVIDLGSKGFKYNIKIERDKSDAVGNMKIFCYDMALARLWAERIPSPKLLVHDSLIFADVDERQRATALETAALHAKKYNFQYITTYNSDLLPWTDFSKGFDPKKYVRLTLTDESPDGCLLGFRYI